MIEAQDTLFSLAEVAVALAGFSAIVIALKSGVDGKWSLATADKFHGMVVHAIFAVSFCFLPVVINTVVQDAVTTMHIACGLLGAQIVIHASAVIFFRSSGKLARGSLALGLLFGLLQFTAFTDWAVQREFEIYVVGVIWHILQAGLLFVGLVWIRPENIEQE